MHYLATLPKDNVTVDLMKIEKKKNSEIIILYIIS